jgi:spore maturation protein CgeB
MRTAFEQLGHEVQMFYQDAVFHRVDAAFDEWFADVLAQAQCDLVFSFNYYPALSRGCQRASVRYISYVYDSPHVALYSTTLLNPCNAVFLFDRAQYEELCAGGIDTVYYLPLAVNVERLEQIRVPRESLPRVSADVSFVGSLYNEKHNLYDRLEGLDAYTKAYLEGIMDAQLKVQGYFFIEEVLKPEVVEAMARCAPYPIQPDGVETLEYIYAQYFIARKLTSIERQRLLKQVSEQYSLKLYTHQQPSDMPGAHFVGAIDWEESMPAVFRHSKVNLNISLRSIRSGIPLRAFDIMGAGGFLLTNYQADFMELFVPGEDFVYYEDERDMLSKIGYYLDHDKERREIAQNAHRKVKQEHTYVHRARQMLGVLYGEG